MLEISLDYAPVKRYFKISEKASKLGFYLELMDGDFVVFSIESHLSVYRSKDLDSIKKFLDGYSVAIQTKS